MIYLDLFSGIGGFAWTSVGLSNNIRLKLLGNTVTVDVISHILNSIPKEEL